jgi:L,D-peptidoglycan transpeptidase YkuD (ErfK/YbiS/YcfS/YnhG family)
MPPLRARFLAALGALALLTPHASAKDVPAAVPNDTLQLVVVITRSWSATAATLLRFERAAPGGDWLAAGQARRASVGKTGLAWGRGLQPEGLEGPEKREGDNATPAGAFRLTTAFGTAARKADIAYTQVRTGLVCVTDKASVRYNKVVDLSKEPMSWNVDEPLFGIDDSYETAVVIDQNPAPSVPGRGACIFIHGWKGGVGKPTFGGVASDREVVSSLLSWLDAEARPVVVILPWDEYRLYMKPWVLPALQAP